MGASVLIMMGRKQHQKARAFTQSPRGKLAVSLLIEQTPYVGAIPHGGKSARPGVRGCGF